MFIRSQDRKIFAPLAPTSEILKIAEMGKTEDGEYTDPSNLEYKKVYLIDMDYTFLGEYSTKEKALKVLDMIQQHYVDTERQKYIEDMQKLLNPVFEMPQDNEA